MNVFQMKEQRKPQKKKKHSPPPKPNKTEISNLSDKEFKIWS